MKKKLSNIRENLFAKFKEFAKSREKTALAYIPKLTLSKQMAITLILLVSTLLTLMGGSYFFRQYLLSTLSTRPNNSSATEVLGEETNVSGLLPDSVSFNIPAIFKDNVSFKKDVFTEGNINGLQITSDASGMKIVDPQNNRTLLITGTNVTLDKSLTTSSIPDFSGLNLSDTSNQIKFSSGVTGTLTWTPASSSKTITLPNATTTLIGTDTTDTLKNKTIKSGDLNTISGSFPDITGITSLGTVSTGTWNGTKISTGYGGTGLTTYTKGDILYSSAADTLAKLNIGTSGYVLKVGSSGIPEWGSSTTDLGSGVTGTLTVATGGTGATSLTLNGVLYGNGTSAVSATSAGSSGQLLLANSSGVPAFASLSGAGTLSSAGVLTLTYSTGQNLTTTSTPTFGGLYSNSNVGIGTTNPSSALTVIGNVGIGATTSSNKLDVWGNSRLAGTLTVDSTGTFGNSLIGYSGVTAPASGLAVSGNVGVGTTSPAGALHVVGQCVTGDTKLRRRRRKGKGKSEKGEDEWDEVDIKDIKEGDEILTLDEGTGRFIASKVKALKDMGIKDIFELTTVTGKTIRTTANHPYLIAPKIKKERVAVFVDAANFEISAKLLHLQFDYKDIVNAFFSSKKEVHLHYYTVNFGTKRQQRFLGYLDRLGAKITTKLAKVIKKRGKDNEHKANFDVEISVDAAIQKDNFDTFVLLSGDSDFTYLISKLQEFGKKVIVISPWRTTARELRQTANLYLDLYHMPFISHKKGPLRASQNRFINGKPILQQIMPFVNGGKWMPAKDLTSGQMIATLGANSKPIFENIVSIKKQKSEQVFDIEVEGTHNFVGNDIVAHNTYINGNLGIGATTSSNKLDVWGNERISGTLTVDSTSAFGGNLTLSSGQLLTPNGSASLPSHSFSNLTNAGLWTNGNGLLLTTGGSNTSGITVTGGGNIGIGTTSPVSLLDVNSKLNVLSGGNVGIGVTSPTALLQVAGSTLIAPTAGSTTALTLRAAPSGSNNIFSVTNNAGTSTYFSIDSSGSLSGSAFQITDASNAVVGTAIEGGWTLDSNTYTYRRIITITNNDTTTSLPANTEITITLNSSDSNQVYTKSQQSSPYSDFRIAYNNNGSISEIARAVSSFSSSNVTFTLKTQAAISASSSSSNYYIYYRNTSLSSTPSTFTANPDVTLDSADTVTGWTSSDGGYPLATETTTKYEGSGSVKQGLTTAQNNAGDMGTFSTTSQGQLPQTIYGHTATAATVGGTNYLYIFGGYTGSYTTRQ